MSVSGTNTRPTSVTTVVVLTILAGVIDVIGGVVTWAFAGSDDLQELTDTSQGTIQFIAIFGIVVGLITIMVGLGLRAGSNGARVLVSILMVVRAVGAIWAMIALGSHNFAEAAAGLLFSIAVLALLWNSKANQYFT